MSLLTTVRRAGVERGAMALWYTGGAGYILKTAGATILIDPFVGPSNPPDWVRMIPPAFDPEEIGELGTLDAVVMSHDHSDHADPAALGPIGQRTAALAVGPDACIAIARDAGWDDGRCRTLAYERTLTVGDLRLTAVPMHDPGAKGCNGYVIETDRVVLLHCGDSFYFPGFAELGKRWRFDAICLSVGANPPGASIYMDEADAARAARDSGARCLIPQHFDLWQGLTLDPRRVATAARWYCPNARVLPARFARRITIAPEGRRD
jgi:L-ascorbate 6-phosphate lactonase